MHSPIHGRKMKTITNLALFFTAWLLTSIALAATHNIILSAERLPNGQFGYKMVSHTSDGAVANYPVEITIPGPTLFVKRGDVVNVQLINETHKNGPGIKVGFNVPGLSIGNTDAAAF